MQSLNFKQALSCYTLPNIRSVLKDVTCICSGLNELLKIIVFNIRDTGT